MTEEKEDKSYDLEERLIDFAVRVIRMAESLPKTNDCNSSQSEAIPPFDIRYSLFDILRFAVPSFLSAGFFADQRKAIKN